MKVLRFPIFVFAMFGLLFAPAASRAQLPLEEIAIALLGDRFGVAPEQVAGFLGRSDLSVYDAAPYYSTSYYTDHPVDEVWRLREQGLGWGQIAHRLGMHPGEFNKLRKSGAFDRDELWEDIYEDRYGFRESDYEAVRRRGGSIRDVLPAAIIARASRTSPIAVYDRYRTVRSWDRTASHYKTNLRDYRRYTGKSTRPAKSAGVNVTRAKTKAVGKGKAQRSASKGQSQGAGKGRAYRVIRKTRPAQSGGSAKSSAKRTGIGRSAGNSGRAATRLKGGGKGQGSGGGKGSGKGGGPGQGKGRK